MSMRATTWPTFTKSPSSTRISATRPGSLVATSTSVASMRPLPLAKPSPSPLGLRVCQASAAATANATAIIPRNAQRLEFPVIGPPSSLQPLRLLNWRAWLLSGEPGLIHVTRSRKRRTSTSDRRDM
ncbi:hypothetical protein D3C81_1801800 [compost metagenome]